MLVTCLLSKKEAGVLFQLVVNKGLELTYAKLYGSVSVDALQRKAAEESACGQVHDPAFKITKI